MKSNDVEKNSLSETKTISGSASAKYNTTNQWVIVDCGKRKIIKCPHKLLDNKNDNLLQGKCRDVSVDTRSFCGF